MRMLKCERQQAWVDDQAVLHRWPFAMQANMIGSKAAGVCDSRFRHGCHAPLPCLQPTPAASHCHPMCPVWPCRCSSARLRRSGKQSGGGQRNAASLFQKRSQLASHGGARMPMQQPRKLGRQLMGRRGNSRITISPPTLTAGVHHIILAGFRAAPQLLHHALPHKTVQARRAAGMGAQQRNAPSVAMAQSTEEVQPGQQDNHYRALKPMQATPPAHRNSWSERALNWQLPSPAGSRAVRWPDGVCPCCSAPALGMHSTCMQASSTPNHGHHCTGVAGTHLSLSAPPGRTASSAPPAGAVPPLLAPPRVAPAAWSCVSRG